MAELPLEEGWVYGQEPKKPAPPPDIQAMFDAADIPKGKLGDLPYPKDWYAGAKERARLRAIEMEELYCRKDHLRQDWVGLVLADCAEYVAQVDGRQAETGPVLGLAELLARTAHERPEEEERIQRLEDKAEQAFAEQARLREALDVARQRIVDNEGAIHQREEEDALAEVQRLDEKRAEAARKRKAEKILARQAALLRGEEVPASDDDDDDEEEGQQQEGAEEPSLGLVPGQPLPEESSVNEGQGSAPARLPIASASQGAPQPTFLSSRVASPSPHPSPELRGGISRQLPPLAAGGSVGASPSKAERGGGLPRSPYNSP